MGLLSVDRVQLEVIIGNDKARKNLLDIEKEAAKVKGQMRKLKQGSDEWIQKMEELKKIQTRYDEVRKEIGLTGLSMKQLRKRQMELNRAMNDMDPNIPEYKKLENELKEINTRMMQLRNGSKAAGNSLNKDLADGSREATGKLSKLADKVNRFQAIGFAFIATITAIAFSLKEWVKGNVGLDDSIANVMKTTSLARKEVRELYSEFKYLNTRTPRRELLLLAEEAGRLGKKSKADVMEFVKVGNKIQTALGDDLGDNAAESIKQVGKLVNIYKIGEKYGTNFGFSMEMIGSAINAVSANSQAQAPFLIDTLKRMGGLAEQAGIMAQDVIGYGSALDQLGQRTETSTTAMNKVILNMFTDTSTYAGIAKMEVADFTNLLKTDANEAFLNFLEGLNGNNEGLTVMGGKLDDLGLDGSRAVQVLASLAANTDLVRKEQNFANKEMIKATSLTEEYNIKNNNMAGNLSIIGQRLRALFVNSTINKGLEKFVGRFAKMAKLPVSEHMEKTKMSANRLAMELASVNTTAERRLAIYNELKGINEDIVSGLNAENIAVGKLAVNMGKYNEQMVKNIFIQKRGEEIQEHQDLTLDLGVKKLELEEKLRDTITRLRDEVAKSNPEVAAYMDKIRFSGRDLISIQEDINNQYWRNRKNIGDVQSELVQMRDASFEVRNARAEEEKAIRILNTAMERHEALKNRLLASPVAPASDAASAATDPKDSIVTKTPEELKKAFDENLKELETHNSNVLLAHLKMLVRQEITEDEHKEALLLIEMDYLNAKLALQKTSGLSTVDTEIALQNNLVALQNYYDAKKAADEDDYNAELVLLEQRYLNYNKEVEAHKKAEKKKTETEKKELKERADRYNSYAGTIGQIVGEAIGETELSFEQFGRNLLVAMLDVLRKEAHLAIGRITIESLAQSDSIATFGASGLARAALLTGLVEAGYSAAASAVNGGYYSGGYTGDGSPNDVAGAVHYKEYVVNHEMMQDPWVANQVAIMEAMRTGNLSGGTQMTTTNTTTQMVQSDPAVVALLQQILEENRKPIRGKWVLRDLEDLQEEKAEIEERVTKG